MRISFLRLLLVCYVCLSGVAFAQAEPPAQPNLSKVPGRLSKSDEPAAVSDVSAARVINSVAAAGGEKRVALVIGNNAYQTVSKLEKAANDARDVGRALEKAGFQIRSVIDGNRTQMNMAINQFVEDVAGGGIGVFFFAGHGVQVNNQNFLIPIDLPVVAREADIADHGISLQNLQDKIADARAKFSLLVIDACRDNPLPKKAGRSIGATRGLIQASSAEGQMVVFSAGANQQALDKLNDNDANPNGIFTREFLPWLTKPGVTIRDAVLSVRSAVRAKAKTVDHDQFPAIYDQAEGNFYFIFQGHATVNLQSAPADAESALWSEVKQNGAREYYEVYLKQYPRGKYAALARVELGKMADREKAERAREDAESKVAVERDRHTQIKSEQDAWEAAKSANSVAGYAAYLDRYPQGRFSALAQLSKQKSEQISPITTDPLADKTNNSLNKDGKSLVDSGWQPISETGARKYQFLSKTRKNNNSTFGILETSFKFSKVTHYQVSCEKLLNGELDLKQIRSITIRVSDASITEDRPLDEQFTPHSYQRTEFFHAAKLACR